MIDEFCTKTGSRNNKHLRRGGKRWQVDQETIGLLSPTVVSTVWPAFIRYVSIPLENIRDPADIYRGEEIMLKDLLFVKYFAMYTLWIYLVYVGLLL